MALTFGLVPHPTFRDIPITKPEDRGQDNLGRRTVKGVVWHRILGSLDGTTQHFSNPGVFALTDYGVGVQVTDGAKAGVIYRWNDPLGVQSGWASGTYSAAHAYGDGAAFVNKYGVNAINRDQASIEISGMQLTPLDEKARDSIASLTAYWADQYGIPWDLFPIAPQDGFSFVRWHQEFGPDEGRKKCPFDVVMGETPALIERTRAILKRYQEGAASPWVKPDTIPWQLGDVGPQEVYAGVKALAFVIEVTAVKAAKLLTNDKPSAKETGPPLKTGDKRVSIGSYRGEDTNAYVVLKDGSRVKRTDVRPLVPLPSRA